MLIKTLAISGLLLTSVAATPSSHHYLGFSCVVLAHRQNLPSAPGVSFRVLKLHFSGNQPGHVTHSHKFGEILYLLSGSGWNMINGKKTPLSSNSALIIPAGTRHEIVPGAGGVTMFTVQFTDVKSASPFEPKSSAVPDVCAS
jgi:quercetin dioxygenase-like cupin family protein